MPAYIQEIPQALNLWEQQTIKATVENSYLDIINPVSGFEASRNGSLKFNITGNDSFVNLFKSYISLKLKLVGKCSFPLTGTVTDPDLGVKVADIGKTGLSVINNIAHSLFKSVKTRIANQDITISDDSYGFKTYIQLLLNSTKENQETYFRVTGWVKDEAGKMDSEIKSDGTSDNPSLVIRRKEAFNDEEGSGEFFIKPHTGINFLNKCIIPFTDIEFELARHDNNDFYLMHKGRSHSYDIEIVEAKYWVQRYKCNPSFVADVEKMLNEHPINYRIKDSHITNFSIPSGLQNFSHDNLFYTGNVPERIIIAFVTTEAFNGDAKKNPFNFEHLNIQSLKLMKNGINYPYPEIITNFQTSPNSFLSAYHLFMNSLGADYNSHTTSITPSEYHRGFYMYSFLMTPDQESGTDLLTLSNKPSQIRLDIRFGAALSKPVQMLVYFENETSLQMNIKREALVTHQ